MTSVGDQAKGTSGTEMPAGGGEMGALMRECDWTATPLGPTEGWPQSLRTVVSVCLSSRFPMLIWWGPELVMLYNDAYRPILGTTKHPAAMGQRGRECWPEIWDVIGPMLEGVFATGEATWSDDGLLLLDRNGYVEECYFTFSYSPIRDESGGVGGVFTAVTETTDRVLGERRLRTLRELAARTAEARSVENACAIAVAAVAHNRADIPFALLYLPDAAGAELRLVATTGLEAGTPASPYRVDLVASEESERTWPLAQVARTGQAALVENLAARFRTLGGTADTPAPHTALVLPVAQAGQERPAALLVVGVSPRRTLDDNYRGFFTLIAGQIATAIADARAYEEARRRAEALAELDRAKTTFFSNISHELRTPLTLALGPVEDVLAEVGDALPAPNRERLEIAHRNHLRLLKLVNTLLDFARIEAGRAQATYEPTDLAALTADLASVFRSAVEHAGLRLVVDCPPLPAPVYVDREMWEKIVLNLLSNAVKYTFEGEIAVVLRAVGDTVALEVRDTGTGISAEEMPHLFERFHRIRGARARTHEGAGIGLALVQELVRLHGGTVRVESTVGEGTCFTVTLPLGAANLPAESIGPARTEPSRAGGAALYVEEALRWLPASPDAPEIPEPDLGPDLASSGDSMGTAPAEQMNHLYEGSGRPARPRVLLADDNADMRDYVSSLLAGRYDVQAVGDGAAALAAARASAPDLILADVMMPELDGFALLRALRADPATREVPIMFLSARAGEESAVEGLQAGADDYLAKPFSARELLARVRAHVELTRMRARATAMERALRAEAEAARAEAERASARVSGMQAVTAALSQALTPQQVAEAVIATGLEAIGAGAGGLVLLSDDGATCELVSAVGFMQSQFAPWERFPITDATPLAEAVRTRQPILLDTPAAWEAHYPNLVEPVSSLTYQAFAALPLEVEGRVLGALGLNFTAPHPFSTEELVALQTLALLCAQALERARLYDTERAARAEAEAERVRLRELFQQAPALIAVYSGPDHIFTIANPTYCRVSGKRMEDLIGRPIRAVCPELEGKGIVKLFDDAYRTGVAVARSEVPARYDRDGNGTIVDAAFTFVIQPLHGAAGTVEGVLLHAVEVTDQVAARRRTEELARQLRAERDRLQQVLDVIPEAILIADATPTFVVGNRAAREILGVDAVGQPVPVAREDAYIAFGTRHLDGTPRSSLDLPLERAILCNEVVQGDQFLIRNAATGRDVPVLANAAPLCDAAGAVTGGVVVFQDIKAIRDLERAREEFLSSAAHDLKTPLTSIRGHAQLAQRRLARMDNPETALVAGQLVRIQEGTDAMLGLINELVDVTRRQMGGGLDLHREPTDLVALVQGCIEAQREASGRLIYLEADEQELQAVVDAARIARVVGNLLSNALKYSSADSAISVRVAHETGIAGPEALIAVRDEGIGIPAADLPHIFDRFQRGRNVAGHIQGTGIGLASARGIVEQHGGTIMVESVEGAGATFTVRLPLEAP